MNTKHIINVTLGAILLSSVATIPTAWADSNRDKESRFWDRHTKAKQEVIQSWKRGDLDTLNEAVFDLSKAEIYLSAYGFVSPEDERLVGRLASRPGREIRSQYDLPAFAYAIFQQELARQVGFQPNPESVFNGYSFSLKARSQQ